MDMCSEYQCGSPRLPGSIGVMVGGKWICGSERSFIPLPKATVRSPHRWGSGVFTGPLRHYELAIHTFQLLVCPPLSPASHVQSGAKLLNSVLNTTTGSSLLSHADFILYFLCKIIQSMTHLWHVDRWTSQWRRIDMWCPVLLYHRHCVHEFNLL